MLNIETKMEMFARVYAKDTGITIRMGANFCTDGKTIYIVPVTDRHDSWIRFMTEVICYHETGHIVTGDAPTFKGIKDDTKRRIFNVVRDVVVENVMETKYVGLKDKWVEFFETYLKKNPVEKRDPATLLLNLVYLRGRERLLGVDFGLKVPDSVQEIFDKKLAKFMDRVVNHTDIKTSLQLAEEIFEALKEPPKPPQPEPQPQPEKGDSDGSKDGDSDGDDGDSNDSEGDESSESSENGHQEDSDDSPSDGDGSQEDNDDSPSDGNGNGNGEDPDQDGVPEEGGSSSDEVSDRGSDADSPDGDCDDGELSDAASEVLKKVQEQMEEGLDTKTLSEEAVEQINQYAETNKIYRVAEGLKENYQRIPVRSGWETEIANYEANGRKIVGYLGGKLKNLFISEHAPIIIRNVNTGRLDTRRLHKVLTGSKNLYCQKTTGTCEDSCVYLVIDHSSSMEDDSKSYIAQSILTTVSNDLDKLRIPFGAVGFTTEGDPYSGDEVRKTPCQLNIVKDFSEPYRRVKHRFVWPTHTNGTLELPGIQHAAYQLAARKESKKVLFILTDGGTAAGSQTLNDAARLATKEFIERLLRAGFKVVGMGIKDTHMNYYCPDFIHVNDLSKFASEFYHKLTKLLL